MLGYESDATELFEITVTVLGYHSQQLGDFINPRVPPVNGASVFIAADELLGAVLSKRRRGERGSAHIGSLLSRPEGAVPIALDVRGFTGTHLAVIADAADKEVLENLGISEVDAVVVSLGDRIDASILVTYYLRELGVKEIYAKAVSEDHGKILNVVGASEVIFPEKDMAERVANRLERSSILEYFEIADGYSIIEWAPPEAFVNKTLAELDLTNKFNVQVIMV